MNKSSLKRKLIIFILFIGSLTLISFNSIQGYTKSYSLYLGLIASIGALFFSSPRHIDGFLLTFVLSIISIYITGQAIYFRAFQQYGLVSTFLSMHSMIAHFFSSVVEFFRWSDGFDFLIILIFIYVKRRVDGLIKGNRQTFSVYLVSLVLILLAFQSLTSFHSSIEKSNTTKNPILFLQTDYYTYKSLSNTTQFVSKYGLLTLGYRELTSYINDPIYEEESINNQITSLLKGKEEPESDMYSGIFKGKSLLLIEAESLNYFAIDPILTPTLYRLMSKGMVIDGYESPLLTGSTSDIELMLNTSLVPTNDGKVVFETYDYVTFPQTLASVFNENGIYSMASHNNYGIYYNRTIMMPKLGYEFFDAIGLESHDNVEDSYVIDHIKWIMYERGQYLSFWITFNAHQPYNLSDLKPSFLDYYATVNRIYPDLPEAEKVYLAKNMDLDQGLKKLIIDYRNSGVLDNMVLILVGDHFPKGLFENKSQFQSDCFEKGYDEDHCFRQPLIIWNNDLFSGVYPKVSSPLDVAPTIFDLFGLSYKSQFMLGHSVFDPNYEGFTFNEYGIIKTDHYTFDPLRDTLFHDGLQEEAIYRNDAYSLYRNLQTSFKIIQQDYFSSSEFKEAFKP